jgi:class 3 adenylate cyclase/tetratricopeptide (TPR) repeat protein
MECQKCQFNNPKGIKFCGECGSKLEKICPKCNCSNPSNFKFCGKCGAEFKNRKENLPVDDSDSEFHPSVHKQLQEHLSLTDEIPVIYGKIDGERKHVTVLFSDLSGYTALSEKLDPEEVKEIISRIFGEIVQVVTKYEGFIEKFIGDAVMAIFGAKRAYEDDPVRAIRAAREIHNLVESLSPKYEKMIGKPLSMHSGINTGLVVTGEVDMEKGTHGISGDTVNLAARLSSLGKAGEILVGPDTHCQAEGYFNFEDLGPTKVKGKTEAIRVYKVIDLKGQPRKVRRIHGIRANLIGRKVEIAQLEEAIVNLQEGRGTLISVCGDAGTGKSRLIEDFKATLNLEKIQWREGHAYAYAQNIPYSPLIDLLSRAFKIKESDSPERIKEKIESGVEYLDEKKDGVVPFIGSLYSLRYPEAEDVSPEFWKIRLQESVKTILSALVKMMPTVICLEDLQWADPPSIELLRYVLSELRHPLLFLCAHRPTFTLCSSYQLETIGYPHIEILLQDLTSSDAQDMMESLLNTQNIPLELRQFVRKKLGGNPFYLEEVINSLIESKSLIHVDGSWHLGKPISESDISPTIYGVISGRIDRLEKETKRILQQASVIGKSFLYDILSKITDLENRIDAGLRQLEQLDLIRTKLLHPDVEYIFKHALTQEVVYNGVLKKERQAIHERIAMVMEKLFQDRLPEFYEALAYHYSQGISVHMAVDYLMRSGVKSHRRNALEEAHQYYKKAFDLLSNKPDRTEQENKLIIDILIEWGYVYNTRGAYSEQEKLFKANEELAESLNDKEGTGMFYAWMGWVLRSRESLKEAYKYLYKALKLGEELENQKIIGYACAWLSWTCSDMGFLDKAVEFGKRALKMSELFESDHELSRYAWAGMGVAYYFRGESKKAAKVGKYMLDYGQRISDLRFTSMGHNCIGFGRYTAGDFASAIECFKKAIEVIKDTIYSNSAKLLLGMSYLADGQFQEADKKLKEILEDSANYSVEFLGTAARSFAAIILMAKGDLSRGEKTVIDLLQVWLENGSRYRYAALNNTLGKFYLQIFQKTGPKTISFIARNIGFLVKTIPFADKKAESCFNKAIEVSKEIGAKGILGQAYLDLSFLHKAKNRTNQARECIFEAIQLFEKCEADVNLKQAKEALESLEQ